MLHSWKIKRNKIRFFERNNKSSVIDIKTAEYNKVNVKLSDTQLKNQINTVKKKIGTTFRINLKKCNGNDLPHELLLRRREKMKVRNVFNNNISTDLKLSKAQMSKIV